MKCVIVLLAIGACHCCRWCAQGAVGKTRRVNTECEFVSAVEWSEEERGGWKGGLDLGVNPHLDQLPVSQVPLLTLASDEAQQLEQLGD